MTEALERFSPAVAAWFRASFDRPTEVQERGWASVAEGAHTLMCAPTGSGKTLAAFLWCIDRLAAEPVPPEGERCRVLYVSPLRALAVDVERNLRAPLRGVALEAERLGLTVPSIAAGIRSGDTPAADRRDMERHPPDILITTPESLFLLLTSQARRILASVRWVIVDEIHSLAPTKRGAHLALSLERLSALTAAEPQRIGLSATQRPLEETARFLGGAGRPVAIVDTAQRKPLDITVEVPVEDMADLERGAELASGPAAGIGAEPRGPRRSIWPAVHPRILDLVRGHHSTIVFANSRRLAERLAARLNELAGEDLVRAHHGSIAREQRLLVEDALKAGRLPALVATSSLELGIDMGAVDLVVQVGSPGSVATGIQRVGRAGHSVGEPSQGTILPVWRGDLLQCAAVAERMLAYEIETTRVPRNPLDVLAQQVVAMCALDEWRVDDLHALVRRAAPFTDLTMRALEAVLDMLAGRYPSDDFPALRPRVVWDRLEGRVRGRAGAQRLAVTSGGTIPDRGLYSVNLLDDGRRVGELDEEMVYEVRVGDTFVLGASTWRILDITPSQVLVAPAPGEPGRIAFWHGDSVGRAVELGRAIGALTRELSALPEAAAETLLRARCRLDERAARNLMAYLRDEREATGALPDDRTVVVERFRDELGDWRVCVLTPLGARVHAPWSLAAAARLRERTGLEVHAIHGDDGFALRLPEADAPPSADDILLDPDEVEDAVTAELSGSALFASRFRENAARALLLPRRRPGERTPLWKQRQRAHDLLQVATRYADFPIVVETYRECLADVFDMPALRDLMRRVRAREVRVAVADVDRASPFASSLLFEYVAQFMYEGDSPLAERRAQALTLDRDLLAELLGDAELRELIDPDALASLELELQGLDERRHPRDADEAADLLRRVGDLDADEAAARGVRREWLALLERERRAVRLRLAGAERWVAVEDAARYRDGLGVALPPGLPEAFLAAAADPLGSLLLRYARTHAPFTAAQAAQRLGITRRTADEVLQRLVSSGALLAGEFHPAGRGRELCHPEVLRALRRRSLAILRREVEPVPPAALGRFLPGWQGVGTGDGGPERLLEVLAQLQGLAVPASVLERDVLPARVAGYGPHLLDQLVAAGHVVWTGRGTLGVNDGRIALHLRADARRLLAEPGDLPDGELHGRLRAHLTARGASFFHDLLAAAGPRTDPAALLDALWDMVWAGEVTNDTMLPVRSLALRSRRGGTSRPSRRPLMRLGPPGSEGRWSLVADLLQPPVTATERMAALAGVLLERHGVLTREAALGEGVRGGFAALYPVLRAMEEAGRVRRGYFVEGLGGAQFALPGAVDRLRGVREPDGRVVALAATDPANPYGVTVPWPEGAARTARTAGAHVVLESGELRLHLERGGHALATFGPVGPEHVEALVAAAGRGADRLEIRTVDAEPVQRSPLAAVLRDAGFAPSPRGLVRWPSRPGVAVRA